MTKNYNENYIREAAYYNWQNAGCPSGQDEYFWNQAVCQLYGTKSSCGCSKNTTKSSCGCSKNTTKSCSTKSKSSSKTTTSVKTMSSGKTTSSSKK